VKSDIPGRNPSCSQLGTFRYKKGIFFPVLEKKLLFGNGQRNEGRVRKEEEGGRGRGRGRKEEGVHTTIEYSLKSVSKTSWATLSTNLLRSLRAKFEETFICEEIPDKSSSNPHK
jgi:hypothetical protein